MEKKWLLVLSSQLFFRLTAGDAVGCFTDGECLDSVTVGFTGGVSSSQECHEFCQMTPNCNYFTHYKSDDLCFAFLNCNTFSGTGCNDCVSSEVNCPDLQCDVEGECVGTLINFSTAVEDILACGDQCSVVGQCGWWTFESGSGVCSLYKDCLQIKECGTCVSGEQKCGAGSPPSSSTFLVVNCGFLFIPAIKLQFFSQLVTTC